MLDINCDGLCEPVNPGGTACYGFIVREGPPESPETVFLGKGVICSGKGATNNLAEYTAVIQALRWVLKQRPNYEDEIRIKTDSKLVVEQLNGKWRVKSPNIAPLHRRATRLIKLISSSMRGTPGHVRIFWVPREQNKEADMLSRKAYAESLTGVTSTLGGFLGD